MEMCLRRKYSPFYDLARERLWKGKKYRNIGSADVEEWNLLRGYRWEGDVEVKGGCDHERAEELRLNQDVKEDLHHHALV